MDSFGNILRTKREEKNLSLETISKNTSISLLFLEALEKEETYIFPSNTYVTGFLRNYANYLEIDANQIVKLFNAKTLQESPTPMELIRPKRNPIFKIAIISAIIVVLGITAGLLYYNLVYLKELNAKNLVDLSATDGNVHNLTSVPFEKRVYVGDTLTLEIDSNLVELEILETVDTLVFETPIGNQFVELSEELEIDVDGKNGSDLVIFLSDISNTDESLGAEIRAFLTITSSTESTLIPDTGVALASDLPTGFAHTEIILGTDAMPFSINCTFRDTCLLRYKTDFNDSVENLFSAGDSLIIQANNATRLWMSNYNVVTMELIADGKTYKLESGKPGEVAVQDIRWIKEAEREYKLVVMDIE